MSKKKVSPFNYVTEGYVKVPNGFIQSSNLDAIEKTIILYIASFKDCFASHRTIAKAAGVSERTVRSRLNRLKKRGVLSWKKHTGKSNHYVFNEFEAWGITRVDDSTPATIADTPAPIAALPRQPLPSIHNLSIQNLDIKTNQLNNKPSDVYSTFTRLSFWPINTPFKVFPTDEYSEWLNSNNQPPLSQLDEDKQISLLREFEELLSKPNASNG